MTTKGLTMTAAVLTTVLANAADAELEDWGPLEEATDHPMATYGVEIWVDGEKSAGIWAHWTLEVNEVIYGVSGRMTVTPEGGEPSEIGAGDLAVFPIGWTGTWVIHETVRKAYAMF